VSACAIATAQSREAAILPRRIDTRKFTKIWMVTFLLLLGAAAVSGCRTAHGFGEDMEHAGQELQDKAQ